MPAPPTPDALHALLEREPFAILDGALATELEADGCSLDDPLWSAKLLLEDPEQVVAVHRRYVEAGADIISTASYQATLPGLRARGLELDDARALLRESVALARRVCADHQPGQQLVAASIGSYGAYLADGSEYRGDYALSVAQLQDFHRPRLIELSAAAPDLLAFETIPSAREAQAIAELLGESLADGDGPPAWVSFSLRTGLHAEHDASPRIADGTPLRDAVAPLLGHPRVAALGVNCVGPSEVRAALELLASVTSIPLIAYPNSGERWLAHGWAGDAIELSQFVALARQWLDAGARILGGCCRTGPAHIRALGDLRASLRAG